MKERSLVSYSHALILPPDAFRRALLSLVALLLILVTGPKLSAQEKTPPRTAAPAQTGKTPAQREDQEPVRVFTEEVRLPIFVTDERGRFEQTLEMDDIVVVEDDVPQEIRSLRRVPANVLLLLDTSNPLTLAKSVNTTRDISLHLISALRAESRVAVLQFNDRVELLQDWTSDKASLEHTLKTRLYSGRRARLSDAVTAAAAKLADLPAGSRHVVLITDGMETPTGKPDYSDAIRQLIAAQATVHIISYTAMTREVVRQKYPDSLLKAPPKNNPPQESIPGGDPTMPPGQTRSPSFTFLGVDLDLKRRRQARDYAKATEQSEARLTTLAEATGGRVLLPRTSAEMVGEGAEVAREIAAEYVVTYQPKRPLASATPGEYRRINVALRRPGLTIHARKGYIVTR
jgi:Ca-activated chloride channel family protein